MIIARYKLPPATVAALRRFAIRAQRSAKLRGELSILIADSREIQELNRTYRRKNKPTDVLSFPSDAPALAGDIAISADVADAQASEHGHDLLTEFKVLILHGILHLAGYDHEADDGEMREVESKLRDRLGLTSSLIDRVEKRRPVVTKKVARPRKSAGPRASASRKRPSVKSQKSGANSAPRKSAPAKTSRTRSTR